MHRFARQIRRWRDRQLEGFFGQSWAERSTTGKVAAATAALTYLTTCELMRDRSPMMAAGLAFFTVLAIVPLLTVAASLMAAFGMLEDQGGQLFDTLHRLFPEAASGLAQYLSELATESAQAVGGIGAATLLVIGVVLFNYIEETLTDIWRGSHDRSYLLKLLTFWAMVTLGPVLIAMSIVQTAQAQIFLADMGLDVSLLARLAPLAYALVAFTLLIKLVPNADVKWRAAIMGGLFSAVAFELAKWGFNVYVTQLLLQTYDRVYGALALIPIGLIWVYITWFVVLVGAQLAYSFQHMRQLLRAESGRRSPRARPGQLKALHPMAPLEVLATVLRGYDMGQGPVAQRRIIEKVQLPAAVVEEIVDYLCERAVLAELDDPQARRFVPAVPAEKIDLSGVVEAFWARQNWGLESAGDELSEQYLEATRRFFDDVDARALMDTKKPETASDEEPSPADS